MDNKQAFVNIFYHFGGSSLAGQANGRTRELMFYVYILKSLKDSGYYVGMTKDVVSRLEYHNQGRVRSTKGRRPFTVVYTERFETISDAVNREKYLKSYKGSGEKLTILDSIQK